MKKFLLSIIMLFGVSIYTNLIAQCTPDVSIITTGVYPAALDTAKINVPYNQVIQYFIQKDTAVVYLGNPINATIDTLFITGIKGLPAGFTYVCNNANCYVLGGTTGCAKLSGTAEASSAGIYPITVYLKIKARAFLGPVPISQTILDSNSRYAIIVQGTTSITKNNIAKNILTYQNNQNLHVYYNSTNDKTTSCEITNLMGQVVAKNSSFSLNQNNEYSLNTSAFKKGIYILNISTTEGFISKKIFIE